MRCNTLLLMALAFSLMSCSSTKTANAKMYMVNFASSDIGDVRFYLELNEDKGVLNGGSIQGGYSDNFGFFDRAKINMFGGIMDKRLISLKGFYEEIGNTKKFRTAFNSPLINCYFNGTITDGIIEGKLMTADSVYKGSMRGELYKENSPKVLTDYKKLSEKFCDQFEANFFDPNFFKSSTYKSFNKSIVNYSSNAVDDLHYVFSVFYYSRDLPYSHIGLWRKSEVKQEEGEEEMISYTKRGSTGILTIHSFSTEKNAIANIFSAILKDSVKNLIVDIRNNPGGNIGPAIELGQYLVKQPTSGGFFLTRKYYLNTPKSLSSCYLFTEGNFDQFMSAIDNQTCIEVKISPNDSTFKYPIYVLTNENTASTCEPVVYALKQSSDITVVGQKTAGKMLSAKEVPLFDGFVLFVPNADYITISGEHLDQKGVEPEITVKEGDILDYTLNIINKK